MNIVITWPKSRPLESYLDELSKAERFNQQINFRVPSRPKVDPGERCYAVHDGFVRGYNFVIAVAKRDDVVDPITGGRMRPGIYVVRHPAWYPLWTPIAMRGFQGWRYTQAPLDA